jgi:hypothetical protein
VCFLKCNLCRYAEYRNRIARHEAAHFLVGYMLGVPVAGYSLVGGWIPLFTTTLYFADKTRCS